MAKRIKKHTINVTGVYKSCTDCAGYLHFRKGELIVEGAVVILPGTGDKEFIVTSHKPECERLK
jgi:hypothetical protein